MAKDKYDTRLTLLACQLLQSEIGYDEDKDEDGGIPVYGMTPIGNGKLIGNAIDPWLTDEDYQRVGLLVAERVPGMTLADWTTANVGEKIAAVEKAIANGKPKAKAGKRRKGRPRKDEKDSATKVITALCDYHGYEDGSVTNTNPATNRGLAIDYDLTPNALTRFLKERFPDEKKPHAKYKAVCHVAARLGALLKLWNRDFVPHSAALHDEEEGETKKSGQRRAGRTPGSQRN